MALRPQDIIFEHIITHNISPREEESLLWLFQRMLHSFDPIHTQELHLKTDDTSFTKQLRLTGFELKLTKGFGNHKEIWEGVFRRNNQWMRMFISFDKNE